MNESLRNVLGGFCGLAMLIGSVPLAITQIYREQDIEHAPYVKEAAAHPYQLAKLKLDYAKAIRQYMKQDENKSVNRIIDSVFKENKKQIAQTALTPNDYFHPKYNKGYPLSPYMCNLIVQEELKVLSSKMSRHEFYYLLQVYPSVSHGLVWAATPKEELNEVIKAYRKDIDDSIRCIQQLKLESQARR